MLSKSSVPSKKIGSSLEAAPEVYVTDPDLMAGLDGVDMAEVCITRISHDHPKPPPDGAFTLPNEPGVGVVVKRAEGKKCARSWRITKDVGSDPAYPDLSARDAAAVREIDAGAASHDGDRAARRSLVWSRSAPLALAVIVATMAIDQAHKWWMLSVYDIEAKGRVDGGAVSRPRLREEHRHQLFAVRSGEHERPVSAVRPSRPSRASAFGSGSTGAAAADSWRWASA